MKTIKTLVVGLMMLVSTATFAQPMNYNAIRNNARFLTDRMAYTLGINSSLLLDDIYRINFDYIYAVNEYLDDIALGYRYDDYMQICAERDFALQMLLGDVVWSRLVGYDYFYRPIVFENRRWHFGIYRHDWDRGHYYFNSPRFFDGYRGGHFFSGMRPNRGIGDRGPGMAGWASRPDHAAGNHGNMPVNHGNSSYRGGGVNPGMGGNRTGQPDMNRGNMGVDMNRNQGGQPDMNRGNMGSDMNRNQGGSRSQGNVQSSSRGNSYGSTPTRENGNSYGSTPSRGNSSSFGSNPSRGNSSSYGSTPSRSGSFGSTPSTSRSSSSSSSSSSRSSSFGGSRSGGTFSGTRAGGSSSGSSAGSSSRGGGSTGGASRSGAGRR